MITTPIILAILTSALMHAGWNFLVKASQDRLLDTAALALGASMLALLVLPWAPALAPASYPWIAASVAIHVLYFVLLIKAYQHADLSLAYPLMRGIAPLVLVLAAPFFETTYSFMLWSGVCLIALGIVLPALLGLKRRLIQGAGLGFALLNAVVIASYTLIDGLGVRVAGSAMSYTLWLFVFDAWGILLITALHHRHSTLQRLLQRWHYGLLGGALSLGSYGIVLWAMTIAPIAAVAALRETSVIFATVLGTLFLKEKMGGIRAGGACLIAVGAILIRLG